MDEFFSTRRFTLQKIGWKKEMGVEQLVLPTQCCSMVLELGHEILIAGQLGKEKTRRRIIQRFYWSARMWRSTAGDVVAAVVGARRLCTDK